MDLLRTLEMRGIAGALSHGGRSLKRHATGVIFFLLGRGRGGFLGIFRWRRRRLVGGTFAEASRYGSHLFLLGRGRGGFLGIFRWGA